MPTDTRKMTKAQMRVRIARDVLLRLKQRKLIPKRTWGELYLGKGDIVDRTGDLSDVIARAWRCEACALGALFIEAVRRFDAHPASTGSIGGASFNGVASIHCPLPEGGENGAYLKQFFSTAQMRLIEIAYERGSGGAAPLTRSQRKAAIWLEDVENSAVRMRRIMNNIIKNKGTLKPAA